MNGFIVIFAIAYLTLKVSDAIIERHEVRKNENTKVSSMQMES